jgi:hypothetical protein
MWEAYWSSGLGGIGDDEKQKKRPKIADIILWERGAIRGKVSVIFRSS